jgi:hypothetical protein
MFQLKDWSERLRFELYPSGAEIEAETRVETETGTETGVKTEAGAALIETKTEVT